MINYYKELELNPSLSIDEIKKELNKVQRKWMKRASNAPELEKRSHAEKMVKLVEEAGKILTNEDIRRQYDQQLREYEYQNSIEEQRKRQEEARKEAEERRKQEEETRRKKEQQRMKEIELERIKIEEQRRRQEESRKEKINNFMKKMLNIYEKNAVKFINCFLVFIIIMSGLKILSSFTNYNNKSRSLKIENKEMKSEVDKLQTDTNTKIEELTQENQRLTNEIEAFSTQNEILQDNINQSTKLSSILSGSKWKGSGYVNYDDIKNVKCDTEIEFSKHNVIFSRTNKIDGEKEPIKITHIMSAGDTDESTGYIKLNSIKYINSKTTKDEYRSSDGFNIELVIKNNKAVGIVINSDGSIKGTIYLNSY